MRPRRRNCENIFSHLLTPPWIKSDFTGEIYVELYKTGKERFTYPTHVSYITFTLRVYFVAILIGAWFDKALLVATRLSNLIERLIIFIQDRKKLLIKARPNYLRGSCVCADRLNWWDFIKPSFAKRKISSLLGI